MFQQVQESIVHINTQTFIAIGLFSLFLGMFLFLGLLSAIMRYSIKHNETFITEKLSCYYSRAEFIHNMEIIKTALEENRKSNIDKLNSIQMGIEGRLGNCLVKLSDSADSIDNLHSKINSISINLNSMNNIIKETNNITKEVKKIKKISKPHAPTKPSANAVPSKPASRERNPK